MSTPITPGRFVWFQLNTPDVPAALDFYAHVCDWGREAWQPDPSQPAYEMWTANGGAHSGTMHMPPGSKDPAHWLSYISTPDLDATVRQAMGLGATQFVAPTDIPMIGRFAVLADPDGAMFAPYQPAQETPEAPPQVGGFSWFELATRDYQKALSFYGALFGWTAGEAMDMGPNGVYQMFCRGDQMVGGMYNTHAEGPMSMPPSWTVYVTVADLDTAVARVGARGGHVFVQPMDIPGGRIAMCTDPQGAIFALHWMRPA